MSRPQTRPAAADHSPAPQPPAPIAAHASIPGEVPEAVERRYEAIARELAPVGEMSRLLVRQVAALSVRLDRLARYEAAHLAMRARHAAAAFAEDRADRVDQLADALAADPAAARRDLIRTAEGVNFLLQALRDLRGDLLHGGAVGDGNARSSFWGPEHARRFAEVAGRRPDDEAGSREVALTRAMTGDPTGVEPGEADGLDPAALRAWARDQLAGRLDAEVARLEAHRATIDHASDADDRREAGPRALFDPSPEAALARRYQATTELLLLRNLAALHALRRGPAEPTPDPAPVPTPAATSTATNPAAKLIFAPKPAVPSALASFFSHREEKNVPFVPIDDSGPHPLMEPIPTSAASKFEIIRVGKSIILPPRV